MIDSLNEDLVPIADVPKRIPGRNGKPIHKSSVYRWLNRGIRGMKLEWIQVGGHRCTSVQALKRFFEQLTRGSSDDRDLNGGGVAVAPAGPRPTPPPMGARAKASREVESAVKAILGSHEPRSTAFAAV